MLAINPPATNPRKLTPNLLPCAIQHNGPISISERYWNPQQVADQVPKTASTEKEQTAEESNASTEGSAPEGDQNNATSSSDSNSEKATTTPTVYFRGRKLHGRTLNIPPTHHGLVLERTEDILPQTINPAVNKPVFNPANNGDSDDEDDPFRRTAAQNKNDALDKVIDIKKLNVQGTFDQVMAWGHEAVAGEDDAFVRGVTEWMSFAEAMHAV